MNETNERIGFLEENDCDFIEKLSPDYDRGGNTVCS